MHFSNKKKSLVKMYLSIYSGMRQVSKSEQISEYEFI